MKETLLYVGTYTHDLDTDEMTGSKGIYALGFDDDMGCLRQRNIITGMKNPTYLQVVHNCLYTTNEYVGGGQLSSYRIDPLLGKLSLLNTVYMEEASSTCQLAVKDNCLFCASYFSAHAAAFELDKDGRIGRRTFFEQYKGSSVNPVRQQEAHTHSVTPAKTGNYVFVADLGMDKLIPYRLNKETCTMELAAERHSWVSIPSGEGPRHMVFHSNGKYAYLSTELGGHIIVFNYCASEGVLTQKQIISTLPEGYEGQIHVSHVEVSHHGDYLITANRGHDRIVLYKIEQDGRLALSDIKSSGGHYPRHFVFSEDDRYIIVANRLSNNITVFEFDRERGKLGNRTCNYEIPSPTCVSFL